jgi:hypothetical protein
MVGLGRVRIDLLVRLRDAREEIAKSVVLGVQPPTHDLHRWAYRAHVLDSSDALEAYGSRLADARSGVGSGSPTLLAVRLRSLAVTVPR